MWLLVPRTCLTDWFDLHFRPHYRKLLWNFTNEVSKIHTSVWFWKSRIQPQTQHKLKFVLSVETLSKMQNYVGILQKYIFKKVKWQRGDHMNFQSNLKKLWKFSSKNHVVHPLILNWPSFIWNTYVKVERIHKHNVVYGSNANTNRGVVKSTRDHG